jgi:hypothetical protein
MTNPDTHPELDRISRMLSVEAGRATVTLSNSRSQHITVRIKTKAKGAYAGRTFVEVPDESEQYGWRSIGTIRDGGVFGGHFTAYRGCSPAAQYAVELLLSALAGRIDLNTCKGGPYVVQAADTCGACGRQLTHPDSIPVGIGPECAAKLGAHHPGYSSQHVATRNRKAS